MQYIKPGTIGYIKDENNVIRALRCLDYTLRWDSDSIDVRWQVAGNEEIIRSTCYGELKDGRYIYQTIDGAVDSKRLIDESVDALAIDVDDKELTLKSYPDIKFDYLDRPIIFEIKEDLSIMSKVEHAMLSVTKDNAIAFIDSIENGNCYSSFEKAKAARPKPQVITFDESENEPAEVDTTCEISNGSSMQPRLDIKADESKAVFLCIGTSIIDWADNNPFVEPLVTLEDFEENGFDKEDFERSQKLAVGEKWQTDFPNEGVFIMRVQ